MKLFIVEYETGEYSDKQIFTSGIFDSREKAELYKAKIESYYSVRHSELYDFSGSYRNELNESNPDAHKRLKALSDIWWDLSSFQECYIIEMDLNDENKKFDYNPFSQSLESFLKNN